MPNTKIIHDYEFAAAIDDDRSGRSVRFKILRKPSELGLAHPFAASQKRRGKSPGTRFNSSFASEANAAVVYTGEVMLIGWNDGPSGSTVSFLLEPEGHHPFMSCVRPSQGRPGSRFVGVLVQLMDDESEHDEVREEHLIVAKEKPVQRTSNVAAMLVRNPAFTAYIAFLEGFEPLDIDADTWLKQELRIASKAELDKATPEGHDLRKEFDALRHKFVEWQREFGLLERF